MSDFEDFLGQGAGQAPHPDASGVQTGMAAPSAPAAPPDFESFLDAEKHDTTLRAASQTTAANAQVPAATAGRAAAVGREIGLPQAAVETNLPQYETQAKVQRNNDTLATSPLLASWVAAHPDSARVAQDEYDKLSSIEKLWDQTKGGALGATQGLGSSFNSAALAVNRMLGVIPYGVDAATGGNTFGDWWNRNMLAPRANVQPALTAGAGAPMAQKVTSALGNLLGLVSQVELTGGAGAPAATEAAAGPLTAVANAVKTATRAMAFPSLTSAVNTGQDVFSQTGDPAAAARAGIGQYFLSTAQGVVPFSAPGGLVQRLVTGGLSGAATGEAQRQAMNLLLPQEMQQRFDPEDMLVQAAQGAMLGGFFGPHAEPELWRGARRTYEDAARAAQAEHAGGALSALGEISAKSALREHDPDAFHEFVRTVTDGSDLDAVYVNGAKLAEAFAQSKVDPQAMGLQEQIASARMTGGDVRIPVADYATHIAGTDLEKTIMPEMKAAPDGMTFAEGQAFYQDAAKTMDARAKDIAAQKEQRLASEADRQQVSQQVFDALAATGRNPDAVNKTYAEMVSQAYATLGARVGMKGSELFAKHPLRLASEALGGDSLKQGDVLDLGDLAAFERASSPTQNNASGESSASVEAINRVAQEKALDRPRYVIDTRYGDVRPLTGVDSADHVPAAHEIVVQKNVGKDKWSVLSTGQNVTRPGVDAAVNRARAQGVLHQGARGGYFPDTHTIALLKDADLSTFLHETGHHFLELMHGLAGAEGAPHQIGEDFDTLLRFMGEKGATPEERMASWSAKDLEGKRAGHEKFAEAFEKYLLEGKAPSQEMQPLFARFRSWLLNVYRAVGGLRAELTPEVRGVMDRMLASDEAIREAEQVRGYQPLFENAKAAGMSMEDFNRYIEQGQRATDEATSAMDESSVRDMKWLSNAKSKAMRQLQRQADATRKAVRAEVENETRAQPVYQAADAVAQARKVSPEDRAAAKDWTAQRDAQAAQVAGAVKAEVLATPEGAATKGIQRGQFLAKNKRAMANEVERRMLDWERQNPKPQAKVPDADMDMIAGVHGFGSGDDLRRALLEAPPIKEVVDGLTDQRMLERHGELVDQRAIEEAANRAVANEARARFMATGLKILTKSPLPAAQIARAAKEAAERTIAQSKVGELQPSRYDAAEARANREAVAQAGKSPEKAIEAQRTAILNNRLASAARDAQDEVQRGLKYLRKFAEPSLAIGKAVGADYLDRINELLSNYDVTNRFAPKDDVQTRASMRDWLDAQFAATGVRPEVSDALLDFTQRRQWKELSVEEFRGLMDSVKSLEHVGRNQTSVEIAGKRMELDDLVAEALASTAGMEHAAPVDVRPHLQHATGLSKIAAKFLNLKTNLRSADAALLKMEQLFQMLDAGNRAGLSDTAFGAFSKIFQRVSKAEAAERGMRADSVKDIRALQAKLADAKVNLHESLDLPLRREGRGTQWYREELLAAALNWGNEGNRTKLTEGYGWDKRQVQLVLDTHLSKAEWQFVQGVWDAVGKYGPHINELQRRLTGITPDMVKADPVQTQHGTYDGGYYPVVYDAFQDHTIEAKNEKNADQLFENQWARPTTNKGHTVKRTDYTGPLHLSLGVIARHLDQVTHDLAWREAIIDANKFLSDSRIKSEIDQVMGREYTKQLRPWLQAMANDKVFNTSGDTFWERVARKARANTTIMGLGYRLSTMEVHGLSALSTSLGEVGTKWMAKGASQFATPDRWSAARDFVYERSPEMAHRMDEMDRNVHEVIDQVNAHESSFGPRSVVQKTVDNAKRFAFYGVAALDMASAMPTWYGAYLKGMAKEGEGGLNMSEEQAIEYANRAVRNAHGGGGVKDLAAVQRDKGIMSLATMFYSFWNHMYNRQRDLFKGYANLPESLRQGTATKDFPRLLARSWFYFVVPQLVHALLKNTPDKDDDGSLGHFMAHLGEEIGLGFVSGVPIVRDLASAVVNGRDYSATPVEAAGKALVKAAGDVKKVATGEQPPAHLAKDAVQAAGYWKGLPLGQVSSSAQFLWDTWNGDADAKDIKDWYQGVTTGKMQN